MVRGGRKCWASAIAALTLVTAVACGSADNGVPPGEGSVSRTPTDVASFPIVDWRNEFVAPCAAQSAVDTGQRDPAARIVVSDPALLDPLCALGLQAKVSASATANGKLPTYLGPQVSGLTTIGDAGAVDVAKAVAASPTLVLTTAQSPLRVPGAAQAQISVGPDWRQTFRAVAAATHRSAAASTWLEKFAATEKASARRSSAAQTQVSLVRLVGDSVTVVGADALPGQILAELGAQRPVPQRVATSFTLQSDDKSDIAKLDGDVVYISFTAPNQDQFSKLVHSGNFQGLGATAWNKVGVVNDAIWYATPGPQVAMTILAQITKTINGALSSK